MNLWKRLTQPSCVVNGLYTEGGLRIPQSASSVVPKRAEDILLTFADVELLSNFIGNEEIVEELSTEIEACRLRQVRPDHMLITGPSGTGKTRLSRSVANELGVQFVNINVPEIESFEKGVLAKLEYCQIKGDSKAYAKPALVLMDEAHMLKNKDQQILLKVLLESVCEAGGREIDLSNVTFIFATTNAEKLFGPLKMRCQIRLQLDHYSVTQVADMLSAFKITDNGNSYEVQPHKDLCEFVAQRSRYTPRIAEDFMTRIYNHVRAKTQTIEQALQCMQNYASVTFAERFFELRKIDRNGLTPLDVKYMQILNKSSRPQGVGIIAAQLGVDELVARKEIEPFLRTLELIEYAAKGRILTHKGREVLAKFEEGNGEIVDIVLRF